MELDIRSPVQVGRSHRYKTQVITNICQVPEDKPLMKFFEDWYEREQALLKAKDGLTEQINRQNMSLQGMAVRYQILQQSKNALDSRCNGYKTSLNQSQQANYHLCQELQKEREHHKATRYELEYEFKEYNKTELELERHYFTLNRLSEFLTIVQISSREDKAVVMNCFNNDNSIGNLILDIEAKKQLIANLEDKLGMAKKEYEYSVACHQEAIHIKDSEIAELEGNQATKTGLDRVKDSTTTEKKSAKTDGSSQKLRINKSH